MKIVLTGCAGFIGSHILTKLLKEGHTVLGIDNFSTGDVNNIHKALKYESLENKEFKFVKVDLVDIKSYEFEIQDFQPDAIIHQAALGSIPRSLKDPLSTYDNNIKSTYNLLTFVSKMESIKRFIYASSSSVYGDATSDFKTIGDEGGVLSPYALSKKICEQMAGSTSKIYNKQCIGLRYFNVFGPRQSDKTEYSAVIPAWRKRIIEDKVIEIHGTGDQTRDFTYIDNVVDVNYKALTSNLPMSNLVLNVGCQKSTNLNYIIELFKAYFIKDIKLNYISKRKGDIKNSKACLYETKHILDYKPIGTLEYNFYKTMDNWDE